MFDFTELTSDKLTLFEDPILVGYVSEFLKLEGKIASGHHNKRWARRSFSKERDQIISSLDNYHLATPQAIIDIKSKYGDLLQADVMARANIEEQDRAIADNEQLLTDMADDYAVAVVNHDSTAIAGIEDKQAEANRQIKLAQVRKNANQLVIEKLQKYIYVMDTMLKALELADLRRAYQAEIAAFAGVKDAFVNAFKAHMQRCNTICPGVKAYEDSYDRIAAEKLLANLIG